jgi:hypothetical protein
MNAQHLSTEKLADAAEGLLDPDRGTAAESHIATAEVASSVGRPR